VPHFDLALDLQPENLWPHFYKGQCAFELGDHREAVASFSLCIGLAPKSARCYYNRGRSYAACGQAERALHDFDRALQLEPALTIAAKERERLRVR
jgi:tetratricopeptide (TPR) repeat protein